MSLISSNQLHQGRSYVNSLTVAHAKLTRRGMLRSATMGRHSGAVPPGYIQNSCQRGVPLIDSVQAQVICEAFTMALSGLSLRQILPRVQSLGLRGREGKPVSLATLGRILTNPFYAGVIQYHGKLYPGSHMPIITEPVFRKVQLLFTKRRCS
jgi:site-specific DNA recombinase